MRRAAQGGAPETPPSACRQRSTMQALYATATIVSSLPATRAARGPKPVMGAAAPCAGIHRMRVAPSGCSC